MSFYLYGASGHAKVIIEILENSGVLIKGLFDDNDKIKELLGYKCSCYINDLLVEDKIIISIGDNKIRKEISEKLKKEEYGIAIDNTSSISKRSKIGVGTVIMPGARINSSTIIGKHNIINTNATIDHDCRLGDYIHISPGASIAGNVLIDEGSHIGIGAKIIPNVNIGKWCIIGAGTIVLRDIPDFSVVVGNPGKIIKTIKNEK